jgi:chromosome segregation ATPase
MQVPRLLPTARNRTCYDEDELSKRNGATRCATSKCNNTQQRRDSMKYTLSKAAAATGKNKATIQRAIKNGKISAGKNSSGTYEIDPSELHRVYPATPQRVAQHNTSNDAQHPDKHDKTMKVKLYLLEAERERERDQLQSTINDLRSRLDRSEERITALLPAPTKRSWWPWR